VSSLTQSHPLHRFHALHHDPQSAALAVAEDERQERLAAERVLRTAGRLQLLARLCLATLFLASAAAKLFDFDATRRAMDAFGLSGSGGLLSLAITAELVGGVLLALGLNVRRAALGLVGYLALASIMFHHDLSVDLNRAFALTNLAIAGGLLLLAAYGPGAFSLSAWLDGKAARRDGSAVAARRRLS
jgi:putative oxidoreductase